MREQKLLSLFRSRDSVGKKWACEQLKWKGVTYLGIRDQLIAKGLVRKGRGQGGTLHRTNKSAGIMLPLPDGSGMVLPPLSTYELRPWPEDLHALMIATYEVLSGHAVPVELATIAGQFEGVPTEERMAELERVLQVLQALKRAYRMGPGWSGA